MKRKLFALLIFAVVLSVSGTAFAGAGISISKTIPTGDGGEITISAGFDDGMFSTRILTPPRHMPPPPPPPPPGPGYGPRPGEYGRGPIYRAPGYDPYYGPNDGPPPPPRGPRPGPGGPMPGPGPRPGPGGPGPGGPRPGPGPMPGPGGPRPGPGGPGGHMPPPPPR